MTNAMVTAHTALHERGKEAKVERARACESEASENARREGGGVYTGKKTPGGAGKHTVPVLYPV